MPVQEPGAGAPGLDPNPVVRADRICIAGTGGAGCALLYNDAKSFCWGQAGTNITDNCQIANGCGYTTCTGNISSGQILCIVYTCKACVPTVCVPATLYITCD